MPKQRPSGKTASPRKGNGRKGRKNRGGVFPKYLERFCELIIEGTNPPQASVQVGKSYWSGHGFMRREDVQKRLALLEAEARRLSVERTADSVAARDQFYHAQLDEMAVHGEGKNHRGRVKSVLAYFQVTHQIYTPEPSRLIFLQRQRQQTLEGKYAAPKPYEATRFKQLKESGKFEDENLKLALPAKPEPAHE
jgi:hypothetical protein